MAGLNSFMQGMQSGIDLGTQIQNQIIKRKMLERQEKLDEIQNAMLQIKTPGLQIGKTEQGSLFGRPESVSALPVTPGTEGDVVKPLGGGILFNPKEAERAEQADIDRRLYYERQKSNIENEFFIPRSEIEQKNKLAQIEAGKTKPEVMQTMVDVEYLTPGGLKMKAKVPANALPKNVLPKELGGETETIDENAITQPTKEPSPTPSPAPPAGVQLAPQVATQPERNTDVLKNIRPEYAALIIAIAEGREAPPSLKDMRDPKMKMVMEYVYKYNPNYSPDSFTKGVSFKDELALRKEFTSDPYVKAYMDVQPQIGRLEVALAESKRGGTMTAVDQALITVFNKMMDPSSVVRESEYARTPQDMAMWNRLKGKAQKLLSGGAGLTGEERKALVTMAQRFGDVSKNLYGESRMHYGKISRDFGIPEERIIRSEKMASPEKQAKEGWIPTKSGNSFRLAQ